MSSAVRLVPREHGTWAMLLVPWAIGSGVARRVGVDQLLLLVAIVALFLAHAQLMTWYRMRASRRDPAVAATTTRALALFATVGVAAVIPLASRQRPATLAIAAAAGAALTLVGLRLVKRRTDHALPGQVLAATALSLTAPAAYVVAAGVVDRVALALWLLSAVFFLWGVFYVRLAIEARVRRARLAAGTTKLGFARETILIDLGLAVAALGAIALGALSPLALGAFVPPAGQAIAGVATLDRPQSLKRVGLTLAAHSIVFAALVILLA